jgi:hypothetical protein
VTRKIPRRQLLCSAKLHSAVSRIFNPPATTNLEMLPVTERCRMEFGDTAD